MTSSGRRPPSLASLGAVFALLSMTNFGGAQSAAIEREVVRKRDWLDADAFLEYRALAQMAPGANSPNLAVLIGGRLRGVLGAGAAFAGATVPGTLIILALGAATFDDHSAPVRGALLGIGAAATGAALANAVDITRRQRGMAPVVIAAAVAAATLAGAPIWLTVPVFVALSLALGPRS